MSAWYEDARFDVFGECDVFIEDGCYLYVENAAWNYSGDYVCCNYQQGRNLDGTMFYLQGEHFGTCNEHINSLEKAPWNIARDIIMRETALMKKHENEEVCEMIDDALDDMMEYAAEGEKYAYC